VTLSGFESSSFKGGLGRSPVHGFRIRRPRITPCIHRFARRRIIKTGNYDGNLPAAVISVLLRNLCGEPHDQFDVTDNQVVKNDFEVRRCGATAGKSLSNVSRSEMRTIRPDSFSVTSAVRFRPDPMGSSLVVRATPLGLL
jgi:hypothetical protein